MVESLKIEMIRAVVLTFACSILVFYLGDALINSLDTKTSYCIDHFSSAPSCKASIYDSPHIYFALIMVVPWIMFALGLLISMRFSSL